MRFEDREGFYRVGDVGRIDEVLLEARLDGGFDLVDVRALLASISLRRGICVEQRNPRALSLRRCRHEVTLLQGRVGDHAQHHRVFGTDVRAEGARRERSGQLYRRRICPSTSRAPE